jgi:hypothetical protein
LAVRRKYRPNASDSRADRCLGLHFTNILLMTFPITKSPGSTISRPSLANVSTCRRAHQCLPPHDVPPVVMKTE